MTARVREARAQVIPSQRCALHGEQSNAFSRGEHAARKDLVGREICVHSRRRDLVPRGEVGQRAVEGSCEAVVAAIEHLIEDGLDSHELASRVLRMPREDLSCDPVESRRARELLLVKLARPARMREQE